MPIFKYTGIDLDGKRIKSTINANDLNDLRVILKNRGITLLTQKETKEKRRNDFFAVSSRVKPSEFVSFCEQFSIMMDSGVSICDSLDVLRNQNFSTVFSNTISKVYESVLEGKYFSEALLEHKKIFPKYFCSLVKVGEMAGNLSETLRKASKYYSNDVNIKKKVRSAMVYPTFLFVVTLAVCLFLMLFVVPTFGDIIAEFHGEMPQLTVVVMNVSNFLVKNVFYIVIGIAAFVLLIFLFNKTKIGKYFTSMLGYKLPVFNGITKNLISARFCLAFGILTSSGMSIVDAMNQIPPIIDNAYFTKKFVPVIEDVNKGKSIYRSLETMNYFPKSLIQVIKVGENTSSIDKVLKVMGDYYQDNLDQSIVKATSLLEPIVIVIMGVLVGIVVLAVLLPMLRMNTTIGDI